MRDFENRSYKGHTILCAPHPKLSGKYEIYDTENNFLIRTYTIKEAKRLIEINVGKIGTHKLQP